MNPRVHNTHIVAAASHRNMTGNFIAIFKLPFTNFMTMNFVKDMYNLGQGKVILWSTIYTSKSYKNLINNYKSSSSSATAITRPPVWAHTHTHTQNIETHQHMHAIMPNITQSSRTCKSQIQVNVHCTFWPHMHREQNKPNQKKIVASKNIRNSSNYKAMQLTPTCYFPSPFLWWQRLHINKKDKSNPHSSTSRF